MTAGALVIACAGGEWHAIGVSDKAPANRSLSDAGADAFVSGESLLPAAYRSTFTKVNRSRFVSQGHASGRWAVDVWANDVAAKALASRSREVPPGAIVLQEHYERADASSSSVADHDAGRPSGPIMLMEKQPPGHSKEHGDWRFAVVGSQGQFVKDGVIESCAGCHDDAPMDGLFPILD
ncbi:MAG TPA: cytochrome P460 family protein [Labilithrix sp.]|nr:cytochrome P460 family protein [Labilithrix sp.]